MIQLNQLEKQFLNLDNKKLSLQAFEAWVYDHEDIIVAETGADLFQELLLFNYQSKEARHELSKILNIDFEQLKLFEIQTILLDLLENPENELADLRYDEVYHEPWAYFSFWIGTKHVLISPPFVSHADSNDLTERFRVKFGDVNKFIQLLLDSISTQNFRALTPKKDGFAYEQATRQKEDEVTLAFDGHWGFIKKDYLLSNL